MKGRLALAAGMAGLSLAAGCAPAPVHRTAAPPGKVMVIIEENHSAAEAQAQMPYLASLASQYGYAAGYHGVTHPSLPNYLVIFAGRADGTSGDCSPGPGCQVTGRSVLGEAASAGKTATEYAESMSAPCDASGYGNYAPRHAVWPYFPDEAAQCRAGDLPMGTPQAGNLAGAIAAGRLPDIGEMIPDLCDDAHNCPLATADAWLRSWVPVLQSGPDWASGDLTIVITFDEDDYAGANQVAFTVVSPVLHGTVAQGTFTHCSLSRWLADAAGVTPPGCAAGAPDLRAAFGLRA
jgi:acid phosphatase